jgi:hypothetical protein
MAMPSGQGREESGAPNKPRMRVGSADPAGFGCKEGLCRFRRNLWHVAEVATIIGARTFCERKLYRVTPPPSDSLSES